MRVARTVVLDNEAVQALRDPAHAEHRRVLALVEATAHRNLRRAGSVRLVVPTTVQVEAGWERTRRRSAAINRLRADRPPLDGPAADRAAGVVAAIGVSPPDAHIGVTLATTPGPHAVVTCDVDDLRAVAGHLGVPVSCARV